MNVKLCDRCGKTFSGFGKNEKAEYRLQKMIYIDVKNIRGTGTSQRQQYVPEKQYDLCPECIAALKLFLHEEEGT